MFRLVLLLLFSIIGELVNSSSILVKDGVYSRVTVQIQDQPQPSSCVDFLDHLEVRELFIFCTLYQFVHTATSRVAHKKVCGDNFIFYMFLDKKQSNVLFIKCQQPILNLRILNVFTKMCMLSFRSCDFEKKSSKSASNSSSIKNKYAYIQDWLFVLQSLEQTQGRE